MANTTPALNEAHLLRIESGFPRNEASDGIKKEVHRMSVMKKTTRATITTAAETNKSVKHKHVCDTFSRDETRRDETAGCTHIRSRRTPEKKIEAKLQTEQCEHSLTARSSDCLLLRTGYARIVQVYCFRE